MQNQFLRIFGFVLFYSGFAGSSFADIVTGNISDPSVTWTVAGNPWIIQAPDINSPIEEITIGAGTTLTIEPGVVVQVNGAISIRVLGTLVARGTVDNPIAFESFDPNLTWRFIEFTSSSAPAVFSSGNYQSGSILEYVNINAAGSKSFANAFANAAVYLNGGRPFINNVSITNGTASGIYLANIDNYVKIASSTISNNHDTSGNNSGGITIPDQPAGANIEIVFCNITGNSSATDGGGILVAGNVDNLTLTDNIITENLSAGNGGGVFITSLAGPTGNYEVSRNVISSNIADSRGGGLVVENSNLSIFNNQIIDNTTNQDDGGGVFIAVDATVDLDSNVIAGNIAGSAGGGVYVAQGLNTPIAGNNINILNNYVVNNHATTNGGGLFIMEDTITILDNVIAGNTVGINSSAIQIESGGTLGRNTITGNASNAIVTIEDALYGGTTALSMIHNSVVHNDSAIDVVLNASGNGTGTQPVVTNNNIFSNGAGFYISNTVITAGNMTATDNYFASTDSIVIAANISGLVDYDPFAMAIIDDPVPISPPSNVRLTRNGDSVTLSWDASPESDLAGYNVHYGTQQAPFYQQTESAGMLTSYTITGLDTSQDLYFAVTAYDSSATAVIDDPVTTINERQVSTHESWFSEELALLVASGSGGGGGGGGSFGWMLVLLAPTLTLRWLKTLRMGRAG